MLPDAVDVKKTHLAPQPPPPLFPFCAVVVPMTAPPMPRQFFTFSKR